LLFIPDIEQNTVGPRLSRGCLDLAGVTQTTAGEAERPRATPYFNPCRAVFVGITRTRRMKTSTKGSIWTRKGVRATVVTAELTCSGSGHASAIAVTVVACRPAVYAN